MQRRDRSLKQGTSSGQCSHNWFVVTTRRPRRDRDHGALWVRLWLVVDMEHSATTLYQAQQVIRVIDLTGSIPLGRVSENDPTLIKRVMDAGAHGVIVPMVRGW